MVSIRRILVPLDFSEFSRYAMRHAAALARWYEAEIVVVHVAEPILTHATVSGHGPQPPREAELVSQIGVFLEPAREAGLVANAVVLRGHPARTIVEHAVSLPADLLVMGTHGRTGFERFMLGSVTERVVRHAPCPVLTVSRDTPPPVPDGPPFRGILCPVDFSGPSMKALELAMSLAEESDARLILLHSLEWLPEWDRPEGRESSEDLPSYLEARARERLSGLLEKEALAFARPEVLVVRGKAWQEILREASEKSMEVIVMGLQGRGPLNLALFGSTTNHVVRSASCPVLTLRGD